MSYYGVDPSDAEPIALVAPPVATNAGADTPLTFARQCHHFTLQNKTAANVYWWRDGVASLGSFLLAAGQTAFIDKPVTVLHLYTVAAENINGTADLNIVVDGSA